MLACMGKRRENGPDEGNGSASIAWKNAKESPGDLETMQLKPRKEGRQAVHGNRECQCQKGKDVNGHEPFL